MFGKKKKQQQQPPAEKISAQVTAIPQEFYGGANPVVYPKANAQQPTEKKKHASKKVEAPEAAAEPSKRHMAMALEDARKAIDAVSQKPMTPVEKTKSIPEKGKKLPKQAAAAPRPPKPANQHGTRKPLIIGAVVVLLLAVAGGSWYFVTRDTGDTTQVATPTPIPPPAPLPEPDPPPPPEPIIPTTTPPVEPEPVVPTTTPGLRETPLQFPRVLLADASDLDGDSLTDEEEQLFGTDVGIWDSDEDGYYDGQEVMNLYNPNGFAPVRLIDSGFVRDYAHQQWQYRVYYPVTWDVAPVDPEERQVLFSAITGDFIEVRVMDRRPGEPFADWFGREATDQLYTDLQPFENRFQEQGMRRSDDLVAYFTTDTHVFIVIYNPGVTGAIPYRHVMQMMYQSFRPGRNIVPLPAQRPIPVVDLTSPTTSPMAAPNTTTPDFSPTSTPTTTETTGTTFGDL